MVNKEKRIKSRCRAESTIVGAGVAQGMVAAICVVGGAASRNVIAFAGCGLVAMVLAVLFIVFKHPAWGIAGTALYGLGQGWTALELFEFLWYLKGGPWSTRSLMVALALGSLLTIVLLIFFIYADYQAVVLRRLERELEE